MSNGGVQMSFAAFIENVASGAGLPIDKRGPDLVTVNFDMGSGRKQIVWIAPIGQDHMSNLIVGFLSPALQMQAGEDLGRKAANDLLRDNAKLFHGAWAIVTIEGTEYLAVVDTQIAHTMQSEEFSATVGMVAALADEMEKKLGTDLF